MPDSNSSRNPTWTNDWGPPTAVQPRLTGTSQTGRKIIIGNPISYVVEPGRYMPFLSLRGHQDPMTRDLVERIQLGDIVGQEGPDNMEPMHGPRVGSYNPHKQVSSTRAAVRQAPTMLSNTSLKGIGPEGLPSAEQRPSYEFWSGLPTDNGLVGV